MKNKRITALVSLAIVGSIALAPTGIMHVKNVTLLSGGSGTTINTTVNNNGNNDVTNVNNTVNNGNNNTTNNQVANPQDNQTVTPASSKSNYQAGKIIVTLGANLTQAQRQEMLQDFGITEGQSGVKFVNTTNRDIAIELGMNPNKINPNSTSISSCKVVLLPKGSGISVTTNNLTLVTGDMLASALTTCGITDASITANAPYPVTGQAALAGILQGFQDVTGQKIPEKNKVVANQEVDVTTSLGNQIGQAKAEKVVTEVKQQVVTDKPSTINQITNIINNVTNNNNVSLTPAQEQELTNLMQQINSLNLNAGQVNKTLNAIQNSIEKGKKDFSNVSKSIENEYNKLKAEGFFTKIENFFENCWHEICVFFDGGKQAVENQNNNSQAAQTQQNSNQSNNDQNNNQTQQNNQTTQNSQTTQANN